MPTVTVASTIRHGVRLARLAVVPVLAMALVVPLSLPFASITRAEDVAFVLDNAGSEGAPGGAAKGGNYDQTFAAVEIRAAADPASKTYALAANETDIPLSWEYYPGDVVTGKASFSMTGTYDPAGNVVTATFAMAQRAGGDVSTSFSGDQPLKFAMDWKGDVTGSIANDVAMLTFSGPWQATRSVGGDTSKESGTQTQTYWFDVSDPAWATVPGASRVPLESGATVSDATGEAWYSPAGQADLEPAARTWIPIKPGDKVLLETGVMLRTGKDGSLKILLSTGALTRLRASTLFGIGKVGAAQTPQDVVYGRLYDGIMDFYMGKWREDERKFEVETDMANTSIKGTTYEVEATGTATGLPDLPPATGDPTTVVTVIEGVVTVTDNATGTSVDVQALERATVDGSGMTVAAAPDASMPPESDLFVASSPAPSAAAPAGAVSAAPSAAASAAASASPGPAASGAPTDAGSGSGGIPVAVIVVIAAIAVVAVVAVVAFVVRRRRA